MVTIVDYGMGNLGSIKNMFKRIGVSTVLAADLEAIEKSDKLVLPGVGNFDQAMKRINSSDLREILDRKALVERIPILGICLGMQLLTQSSEEGTLLGLGWIKAATRRFPKTSKLKVPHMGWNIVSPVRESPISKNLPDEIRFYFVHSFYVQVENEEDSILKAHYGINFDAAIQHGNIFGAQFHPEKSHKFGRQFLTNFANL
tara:strand:- start:649 stop:1254 length:606 start_codon:yes stop_codon:yes gene_type:complete